MGAGTAGSVLASRLSEADDVTVLLLEAGPDDRGVAKISTPALAVSLWHSPLDWEYYTEPQKQSHQGFVEKVSARTRIKIAHCGMITVVVFCCFFVF